MKIIAAFLMFMSVLCTSHMSTYMKESSRNVFDLQGHRGSRGLMPENTVASMIEGIKLGVVTLEMDAVITKDKQVILSHEPFFNHEITTKPDGTYVTEAEEKKLNIYEMTFAETQKFDVGLKPNVRFPKQKKMPATKPALATVIDSAEAYSVQHKLPPPMYNIETKSNPSTDNIYHPEPAEFVDLLMGVIRYKLIDKRVIIQSFDPRTLQYLHKNYPGIKTALLIEGYDKRTLDQQIKDLGFIPTIYSPEKGLVTSTLIKQCHDKKMEIIPWTPNDAAEMKKLKAMGVDGLITDYPNIKF